PRDIPGWCASNDVPYTLAKGDKHFVVTIALQGAPLPSTLVPSTPPQSEPRAASRPNAGPASIGPRDAPPGSSPASNSPSPVLDLRRQKSEVALLLLGQRVMEAERVDFVGDDPMLERHLRAWARVIGARVECARDGVGFRGTVRLDPERREPATDEFDAPSLTGPTVLEHRLDLDGEHGVLAEPAPVAAPERAADLAGPRRLNKATLMVLHNDFERLVAAFLTANACVAQGMEVEMVFTFWGVNVLRAPVPRTPPPGGKAVPLMKKMMKWMMPAGPDAQQMSKMNMGGMGVEMMKFFMKKDNILGIRQLMQQAADNGVKFTVCTMSMGVMGIEKSDLMPWPNLGFGGVVTFTASARESAVSLVF
ncbi:MAG: DsrE/DsrF/DrsH-like family protein, partial [Myxococcota bacterium]